MNTLYGIPNCDTMKKARAWLDGHGIAYAFHDYKKAGLDEAVQPGSWCFVALGGGVQREWPRGPST